uniref:Uncharacterized protein n=1 Tax=Stegastes partitus TaxID=144197 RepID=A0A3B5AIK5_9TELE
LCSFSPFCRLVDEPSCALRHLSLVDGESLVPPFFQFDRQAPGRISTSPTLRRMRSTRRPLGDSRDPSRMGSTQEEPSSGSPLSPRSLTMRLRPNPLPAEPWEVLSSGPPMEKDNGEIYSSARRIQAGTFSIESRHSPPNIRGF